MDMMLPFEMMYVFDLYKTQEMCDETVDHYAHALEFVPDCYKTQKMCNKTVEKNLFYIKILP